ncbi:hypothetical protein ADL26_13935 [Thermoactinomyces vulgaris]|nr:hypothetical protein ADL26_13935 [Thermoactinomyces vulgaris]
MRKLLFRNKKKEYPSIKHLWRAYWVMFWILFVIIYTRAKFFGQNLGDLWDLVIYAAVMLLTISFLKTYSPKK